MALSPADFAAYSRATGAPYPEDPEERAQLAPEVAEFRRNQLRSPEQEINLPEILGSALLGMGAVGAAIAGSKKFGRGIKNPSNISANENIVRRAAQPINYAKAADTSPVPPTPGTPPSSEGVVRSSATAIPQSTISLDEYMANAEKKRRAEVYANVAKKAPSELPTVYRPKGGTTEDVLITDPNTGEIYMRGRSPQSFSQKYISAKPELSSQALSALESGEDQLTGRTMRAVQRNEDLDISQVNQAARQTGSANVAASLTPDGVPVDQTASINAAQSFLEQKRLELASSFSPTRVERVLSASPDIAEAAELYAATGDPLLLSRFSQTPSTPLTVKPAVQMSINDPNLPTSQFFKATGVPEYTGNLLAEDIELTNQISSLGAQQQALTRKAQELGEQELMLRVAMDRDPASGGEYTKMFAKVKNEQQNLPDPASLNVDLGDAIAERDYVRGQMKSLQDLGSTYKLTDVQEGVRPYYEYDELGQIIPSTLELRGGRKAVDLGPKAGGGRLVAEYDPAGQTGSTKGIYGVEQTSRRSGETTRPTQMTMRELVREGMEQAVASPEGDVPIPPSLQQMTERIPTSTAKRSLQASEIVRRAIIEGRDPQMILRQRGFSV